MNDDAKRGQQQDRPRTNPGAEPGRSGQSPGQERGAGPHGPDRSPQGQANQARPMPKTDKPQQGLKAPQQEEGESETGNESGDRDKHGSAGRQSER